MGFPSSKTFVRYPSPPGSAGLLVAIILGLLLATLTPQPGWVVLSQFGARIPRGRAGVEDLLANALLFLPIGFALAIRGWTALSTIGAACALSMGIELVQFVVPGRFPSVFDVVLNTAGAAPGVWLAGRWRARALPWLAAFQRAYDRVIHPEAALRRRLMVAAFAGPIVIAGLGAWIAVPAVVCAPCSIVGSNVETSNVMRVGGWPNAPSFCGLVDDVRIYDRALSRGEIRAASALSASALPASHQIGLVAAYDFDEAHGATVRDVSGHGVTGRLAGATWSPRGRSGGAIFLHHAFDHVEAGPSPALNVRDRLTLEAWIWPDGQECGPAVLEFRDGTAYLHAGTRTDPLRPYAGARIGLRFEAAASGTSIPPRQWTHLAMTFDGPTWRFYVNGEVLAVRILGSTRRLRSVQVNTDASGEGSWRGFASLPPWQQGAVRLVFDPEVAAPLSRRTRLAAIVGERRQDLLTLGQVGDTVDVRYNTRLARLGAPPVALRVPRGLAAAAGNEPLAIALTRRVFGPIQLQIGASEPHTIGLTPAMTWTLLIHAEDLSDLARRAGTIIVALWWLVPLGYFTSGALARGGTLAAAHALALMAITRASVLAPPVMAEWIAMVAGLAFGWLLPGLLGRNWSRRPTGPRGRSSVHEAVD